MNEFQVEITTPDGSRRLLCRPTPTATDPFRLSSSTWTSSEFAKSCATSPAALPVKGYFCLLPDMFYRLGPQNFDLSKGREEIERMFAAGRTLEMPMVMSDTNAWLDYFDSNPVVPPALPAPSATA